MLESAVTNSNKESRGYNGLSEKEAIRKYEKHGPNSLSEKKKVSAFQILLEQFCD
ncbi:MAG: hypothetical protein GX660_24110, partial [Clostridiaceae bacterium]|nr:hypothetical protein [Clostridiaceae bacterium]